MVEPPSVPGLPLDEPLLEVDPVPLLPPIPLLLLPLPLPLELVPAVPLLLVLVPPPLAVPPLLPLLLALPPVPPSSLFPEPLPGLEEQPRMSAVAMVVAAVVRSFIVVAARESKSGAGRPKRTANRPIDGHRRRKSADFASRGCEQFDRTRLAPSAVYRGAMGAGASFFSVSGTAPSVGTSLAPSSAGTSARSYFGGSPGCDQSTQYAFVSRTSRWTNELFG